MGIYKLMTTSSRSLILRSVLLHHLLLVLLRLHKEIIGLACLGLEVIVGGQKQLVINSRFIKEHTSDGWSKLLSVCLVDGLVNMITNKVVSIVTLQGIELSNVDLRKLHFLWWHLMLLLWLHHHMLLLNHWLLLLTNHTLHATSILWHILVVTTSIVVVLLPLLVIVITFVVISLASITVLEVSSLLEVATASSSSEVSTSTSGLSITPEVLISILVEVATCLTIVTTLWSLRSIGVISTAILLLNKVDQLSHVVDVLVSICILSLILCLPEVHFQWLDLVWEQSSNLIEELDCLLGLFHTFIKYISNLIFWRLVTILSLFLNFVVFKFYGDYFTSLLKNLLNFILGSSKRDEFNIKVRFEHFLLVLLNLAALLQFALLLVDMGRDKNGLTVNLGLHVRVFQSFFGSFMVLETNETLTSFSLVH